MKCLILAALALAVSTTAASAGVYGDDLAKCLVEKSGAGGQTTLVQWVFTMMSLNPVVAPYAAVSPDQRSEITHKSSAVFVRLLTVDCRPQAVAAIKYEGNNAVAQAFQTLGEVAMRGLMSDPMVMSGMNDLGGEMDKNALQDLFKEAGVPTAAPPAAK